MTRLKTSRLSQPELVNHDFVMNQIANGTPQLIAEEKFERWLEDTGRKHSSSIPLTILTSISELILQARNNVNGANSSYYTATALKTVLQAQKTYPGGGELLDRIARLLNLAHDYSTHRSSHLSSAHHELAPYVNM